MCIYLLVSRIPPFHGYRSSMESIGCMSMCIDGAESSISMQGPAEVIRSGARQRKLAVTRNGFYVPWSAQSTRPPYRRSKIGGRTVCGLHYEEGLTDSGVVPVLPNMQPTLDNLLDPNAFQETSAQVTAAALSTSGVCCLTPDSTSPAAKNVERIEGIIERAIFDCRFLTLFAVVGSLAGSVLCFFQGSMFVVQSFKEYFKACLYGLKTSQVILYLVEAVDVYLMGTVMLIFGMGLYELFVSSLEVPGVGCADGATRTTVCGSNLFGLFRLRERPKWLEIRSLDELKTKLGHVIVMILLVGMFEKSKKVPIHSGLDLLCFAGSILLASGCLYLLSMLHLNNKHSE